MRRNPIKQYAAQMVTAAAGVASPQARALRKLRASALATPRYQPGEVSLDGLAIRYVDLLSVYMEYKDIVGQGIYSFEATNDRPRILDGGGYIGLSALTFKRKHSHARLTCFEPDPAMFEVLGHNLRSNGFGDVELVQAALAAGDGEVAFEPDQADGGRIGEGGGEVVPTVRLSSYLDEPIDFLKLNIEGQELPVLQEAGDRLANVREMVLEYHGWADGEQRLGPILDLLDDRGFRYLVNHFDYETNGAVRPPFEITKETTWFALVYARRADLV